MILCSFLCIVILNSSKGFAFYRYPSEVIRCIFLKNEKFPLNLKDIVYDEILSMRTTYKV